MFAFVFQMQVEKEVLSGQQMHNSALMSLKKCYGHTTENLFFCPLTILSLLAVGLFGARGNSVSHTEKVHRNTLSVMSRRQSGYSFKRCHGMEILWMLGSVNTREGPLSPKVS